MPSPIQECKGKDRQPSMLSLTGRTAEAYQFVSLFQKTNKIALPKAIAAQLIGFGRQRLYRSRQRRMISPLGPSSVLRFP